MLTIDQANSPDLREFMGHEGKLLHYAGWAENVVSAGAALRYYEQVNAFMRSHTNFEMDDLYRLFLVPSMEHW